MKQIPLILFLFLSLVSVRAQEISISGKVTDASDGSPIPGVSIMIKGTTSGAITDIDGMYTLKALPDATLTFTFIGMKPQDIAVDNRTTIDVSMQVETKGLDELVVIGYGTQKRKDVTGAVAVIGNKTIEEIKPVKIEQALQGTLSGVNVTSQSGAPGADLNIRIRGIGTNIDPSPTVIIDGYEGDLNTINPDDIETITVLKDAQAAIYGTIGANGIVMVTTKKGKKNSRAMVSINSSYGIQETSKKLDVLNATEYAVLLNESYAASGENPPYSNISSFGRGTNWQNELFQKAPIRNNNISITGGGEKLTYAFSGSDLKQEGIIGEEKTGYKRNTARMSLNADLSDKIKLNSSMTYTYINRQSINDFGLASVLFNALNMPSVYPVYDENGDYFQAPDDLGNEIINPLAQIANTYNDYNLSKFNGNFGLDYKILPSLTATARIGFNTTNANSKSFSKLVDYGIKVFSNPRSSVTQYTENPNDYTFDAYLNYDKILSEAHHLTVTLGMTVYKEWGKHLEGTGYDVPYNSWEFADIKLADGIKETKSVNSWDWDQRRLSYFTRLQYDYNGKYLLSAMFRRDASTKFGPDKRVGYFPSTTLGWKISEEEFMKDVTNLDLMKLRLSYGILGSDKIYEYQYLSLLNGEATYVFDNALAYGKAIGTLPNPSIKWEESEQFDVGMDFTLFNNRLDINADYFIKTTRDLLIQNIPVSGILGTYGPGGASPTINAGTVQNKGFEFAIGYRNNISRDISFGINYNITTLKNEVLEVNNGTGFIEGGSFGVGQPSPARMETGYPIGYFYGYKTDGIFQSQAEVDAHPSQLAIGAEAEPGDFRIVDTNNDGVLNSDDRTYIGDPVPDYTMGLNITLNVKGFDFITYTFSSIGNDIVRNYERTEPNANKMSYNMDRWTGPGTSNTVPRLTTAATTNTIFSDFYVEDGSFLRIQNIQLGYTIPKTFTGKIGVNKLRLFANISNLYTLTKYMGYDPAASSGDPIGSGIDFGFYPQSRTYTLGLNLNF